MAQQQSAKHISIDALYLIASISLLLVILQNKNEFDIIYLVIITFYYLKIKINRKLNNKKI